MTTQTATTPKKQSKTKFDRTHDLSFGCKADHSKASFRLFAPRATEVKIEIFEYYEDASGEVYDMEHMEDGIWHLEIEGDFIGCFYGYYVKDSRKPDFIQSRYLLADPYSRHVASTNHFHRHAKTMIINEEPFDWEDDQFIPIEDPRDLIVYEAHLKDMTIHPSADCQDAGSYKGFIDPEGYGGVNHLKRLGVNAVELLPLQNFAGFEPPYKHKTKDGFQNLWNPYGRNHWGYMTSFFFAPETMYASNGTTEIGKLNGLDTRSAHDLKEMVKGLHKEGIAVILDVVYNHVSQYDLNPLKFIDKAYYFRLDDQWHFTSQSGCGNDFKTESPMARKLIVESIKYWIREYHIDGFRFDLANLIDRDTIDEIKQEAQKLNPHVVLIAEPWGGGYDPTDFSKRGWPAWNDQIRNGVKGSDPVHDKGFIFGSWQGETSREALENFARGTLLGHGNGRFEKPEHSVNYLESHDGYTLGDFIRIGLNPELADKVIKDKEEHIKLSEEELKISKLAALYLFSCQGITMIHEGQEWARSKVIAKTSAPDPNQGKMDHNSYEKDNSTNHLNYDEISLNQRLFNFYQGLIHLRNCSPALRRAKPEEISIIDNHDALHLTFRIKGESSGDRYDYLVSLNGNRDAHRVLHLPAGFWEMVVSAKSASCYKLAEISGTLKIPETSGVMFRKLRE